MSDIYLGLAAMRGNEFLERVGMTLITDPAKMTSSSPLTKSVALPTLKKFTIMQIALSLIHISEPTRPY